MCREAGILRDVFSSTSLMPFANGRASGCEPLHVDILIPPIGASHSQKRAGSKTDSAAFSCQDRVNSYFFLRKVLSKMTPPTGIRRSASELNTPEPTRELLPLAAAMVLAVLAYPGWQIGSLEHAGFSQQGSWFPVALQLFAQ